MTDSENRVIGYISQYRSQLYRVLSDLIGYDSQNFITSGREQKCAEHIHKLYEAEGLVPELYYPDNVPGVTSHSEYQSGRGTDTRPNVTGVFSGDSAEPACMLAAHIDTMPAGDLSKWSLNPFGGTLQDGRIYGLGACDNKFGIAAALFAVRSLRACGIKLKKSVVLSAYADEEYGGGGGALACCLKYPCSTIVNLDSGNHELWVASLGGGGFGITVACNGAVDTVSPVIDALYTIKAYLEPLASRHREELERNSLYTGSDMARSALRILEFGAGSFGTSLDSGKLLFVLYTTSAKETIEAELKEIFLQVRPKLHELGVHSDGFYPTTRFFRYHITKERSGATDIMARAAEDTSGRPAPRRGACLSDLSIFLGCGSPESFGFGIMRDFSLKGGAHQPDEFVDCKEFLAYTQTLALFLMRYIGTAEP